MSAVPKVNDLSRFAQPSITEVRAGPTLNSMEWMVTVRGNQAVSTERGLAVTRQAAPTVGVLRITTRLAIGRRSLGLKEQS